jgi:hypothetical protein
LVVQIIKKINWSKKKKKMAEEIKMAAKHKFSKAQPIFMQIN